MTTNIEAEAATREENNAALIAALDETSLSEVESSWELDVINDAERGRWIATLGAEAIAELPYRFVGGRVVLLTTWVDPASAILHDWNDEHARTILRRCAEAAGSTGKVFVIEKTGPDGESPSTAMDLRMLVYFGGRERAVTELTTLAADAGLNLIATHRADALSIIEYTPS